MLPACCRARHRRLTLKLALNNQLKLGLGLKQKHRRLDCPVPLPSSRAKGQVVWQKQRIFCWHGPQSGSHGAQSVTLYPPQNRRQLKLKKILKIRLFASVQLPCSREEGTGRLFEVTKRAWGESATKSGLPAPGSVFLTWGLSPYLHSRKETN